MWLGAATKGEERVSQLHGAAPNPCPPQPNAGTVQSLSATLSSSRVSGANAALAPGSPLLVMAVMVAGSLSRLPARLVMLIW